MGDEELGIAALRTTRREDGLAEEMEIAGAGKSPPAAEKLSTGVIVAGTSFP